MGTTFARKRPAHEHCARKRCLHRRRPCMRLTVGCLPVGGRLDSQAICPWALPSRPNAHVASRQASSGAETIVSRVRFIT
ncbi:hypothetical protein BHM03_00062308 [Ensete ventricosum]|nr:hypothetical protein BHM03_00062308 [Ensete ventricosum]